MTYYDELISAIHEWEKKPIEDEWLFEKFRCRVITTMSTDEAFRSIGVTVDVLIKQPHESSVIEILETIICLARRSDTTEVPPKLIEQKTAIIQQVECYGDYAKNKLKELLRFYRLNSGNQ